MHVFRSEWFVTLPWKPAFFAAVEKICQSRCGRGDFAYTTRRRLVFAGV